VHTLNEELRAAVARTAAIHAKLELAHLRESENEQLAATGAGNRFSLEEAASSVQQLLADLRSSVAAQAQVRAHLDAKVGDDQAEVAQIKAQLATAQWELSETVFYAPADGTVINLELRPGQMATALGARPVMTFVENEFQVLALFSQNELHEVRPGDEAEIALETYPGRIIKAEVDSVVWAQGQGQLAMSAELPETGATPQRPGRFAVRLRIAERDRHLFLAAGAVGHGAIYTQHGHEIQILRKVIIRVGAFLDYLVLKLH
jgi:multidrug resistance efflux pump